MGETIILFNGYKTSRRWYKYRNEYNSENLKRIDFLDRIREMGEVYIVEEKYYNLSNYKRKSELTERIYRKYGMYRKNIKFRLEDIDYKKICERVYRKMKNKYGNNKRYIVIGHSYGGTLALLFSKMYKEECKLCCCLDNPPNIMEFFKKYDDKENKEVKEEYNEEKLRSELEYIRRGEKSEEKDRKIDDIFRYTKYRLCEDRIRYYDENIYIKTIFFRAYYKNINACKFEKDWNKYGKLEEEKYRNNDNLVKYIYLEEATHFIWRRQEYSDVIIREIKETINKVNK